ncbi:MAG: TRAP transporter small permease [Pseudomonadota bacterium]
MILKTIANLLFAASARLADLAIAAMMVLVALEILLRSLFASSLLIADEFAAYALVAATFLGLPIAIREAALFRFEGLLNRIPDSWRPLYERFLYLLAILVAAILLTYLIQFVESSARRGIVSHGRIEVPIWIPQLMMPLGMGLSLLALIERLLAPSGKA